jgi:predicted PurR-regulated permease PerM
VPDEPKQIQYPTPWQRKAIWSALTALSVVAIGGVACFLIYLLAKVLGYFQPILIPFAVAGVLAYLLEPVVARMCRWGIPRTRAVALVFLAVLVAVTGIFFWVVPEVSSQSINFARNVPDITRRVKTKAVKFVEYVREKYHIKLLPDTKPGTDGAVTSGTTAAAPGPALDAGDPASSEELAPGEELLPGTAPKQEMTLDEFLSGSWIAQALPTMMKKTWDFIQSSVGGFLGVFGFLLSMIIVPLYLFYFLANGDHIAKEWGGYLPIRESAFKDEVVSALNEINGYIISFFRGQLIVAMINGLLTGIGLFIMGLNFALLIGLMIMVLNLVPYIGIILCWFPAVVIALVQYPGEWFQPLVVTLIFIGVQQIDGWFISPKIVGDSVGLHPMTVIMSVFVWSLLMGGLLGAILAIPLTATLKVLLKRYVWQPRMEPQTAAESP